MTEKDISTNTLARMNSAIEKLDLEYGVPMKFEVGSVECVKKYLEGQQRIVNSDTAGSLPAFKRVVELMKKLKK